MVYAIELSFDFLQEPNISSFQEILLDIALSYECEDKYFMHEVEGSNRICERSHCIFAVTFCADKLDNCLLFLKEIRRNYRRSIYIECIYRDELKCNLIYASKKYLDKMDKHSAQLFKRNRKHSNYTDSELAIINLIKK